MSLFEQHFLKVLICWLLQDTSIWAKSKQGSYILGRGRYQQTNPRRITAWFLIHVHLGWDPEITTMYVYLSETSGWYHSLRMLSIKSDTLGLQSSTTNWVTWTNRKLFTAQEAGSPCLLQHLVATGISGSPLSALKDSSSIRLGLS